MSVDTWSTTPSENADKLSVSIAENCDPGNLNDVGREIMAAVKA